MFALYEKKERLIKQNANAPFNKCIRSTKKDQQKERTETVPQTTY